MMQENIKVDSAKKENREKQSSSEQDLSKATKAFIPPSSGINPVAVQKKLNPIQKMQELPESDKPSYFQPNTLQKIQLKKDEEEKPAQLKEAEEELPKQLKSDSSKKMPEEVQAKMEGSFGTDFSNVNIHEGSNASEVNALAYTQGNDIHFAPGQFNPQSKQGQELLGHELTHVVQQREGRVQPTVQKKGVAVNDDKGLEKEADDMGRMASEGKAVNVQGNSNGGVQFKTEGTSSNNDDIKNSFILFFNKYLTDLRMEVESFVNDFTTIDEEESGEVKSSVLDFVFNAFGIGDQYSAVLQVVNLIKEGLEGAFDGKTQISLSDFRFNVEERLNDIKTNNADAAFNNFSGYCSAKGFSDKSKQIGNFFSMLPNVKDFRKHLSIGWIKSAGDSMWDYDDGKSTAGYIYLSIVYQGPYYPLGIKTGKDTWIKSECFIDDVDRPAGTNEALKHAYGENTELTKLPLDIQVRIVCGQNEGKYVNHTTKEARYDRHNGTWTKVSGNDAMFTDWLAQNKLKIKDLGTD